MIGKMSNRQPYLFPINTRELADRIGLDWWAAKKLYDDKWLSFDPENTSIEDDGMEAEFVFLGSLVAAGVEPHLLARLLADLERPYQYDVDKIYYDWKARSWAEFPLPQDPDEIVAQLIDSSVDEGDTDTLERLRDSVRDALEQLRSAC